jgi:hypothetical protein
VWASPSPHEHGTDGPGRSKQTQAPGAPPQPPGEPEIAQRLARTVESLEAVQGRLADLGRGSAPDVHWLEDDDELAGRLQRVLGRQARARGIELS